MIHEFYEGDTCEVSRDIDDYEITAHFRRRFRERTDPEPSWAAVEATISGGELSHSTGNKYVFDRLLEGDHWHVVVGIVPEILWGGNHNLMSVYTPEHFEEPTNDDPIGDEYRAYLDD